MTRCQQLQPFVIRSSYKQEEQVTNTIGQQTASIADTNISNISKQIRTAATPAFPAASRLPIQAATPAPPGGQPRNGNPTAPRCQIRDGEKANQREEQKDKYERKRKTKERELEGKNGMLSGDV